MRPFFGLLAARGGFAAGSPQRQQLLTGEARGCSAVTPVSPLVPHALHVLSGTNMAKRTSPCAFRSLNPSTDPCRWNRKQALPGPLRAAEVPPGC